VKRRTFLAAMAICLPGLAAIPSSSAQAADASTYIVSVASGVSPTVVAASVGVVPTFTYTHALNGFAGALTDAQVAALQANPVVTLVERDQVATINTTEPTVHSGWDTWGLDRTDQRALPLSSSYTHNNTGAGVHVYMFDTGIRFSHVEFGGRASAYYDAIGDGQNGNDCNGHGTHTSGTVGGGLAGQVTGIANGVTLHSVRILDCSGSGTSAQFLAGLDYVTANHQSPAVASMSVGFNGIVSSVDTAVQNMINSGVTTVVAAGNSRLDACNYTPSRVAAAITVAASDSTDHRASFSNKGSCVDLYAPGVAVWSAWYTSDTALSRLDGTSMATPHVSGVAALYLQSNPGASPATVQWYNGNNESPHVILQNPTGTPNRLLYSNGL
jgi:subtilisin family serine protease